MSGLSIADMRRIGERRNTETVRAQPAQSGLISKLGFSLPINERSGRASTPRPNASKNQAVNRLNQLQGNSSGEQTTGFQPEAAQSDSVTPPALPGRVSAPVTTDPFAETPTLLSAMTAKQAAAPLRSDSTIKACAGAGLGAALGFAATGLMTAVPAGLVVGGMGGLAIAKRGQAYASSKKERKVVIKRQQAEHLYCALEEMCMPFGVNTPSFTITITQSAALKVESSGKPTKRKLAVTIGFALLAGLSIRQIQALFAQTFGRALAEESTKHSAVPAETVASLDHVQTKNAARVEKSGKPSPKLDNFNRHVHSARFAWANTLSEQDRQADNQAAAIVGSAALVDAILAQGLIAQRFNDGDEGVDFNHQCQSLRAGYGQEDLNLALKGLAATTPDAKTYLTGLPMHLLERVSALDTSIPIPSIPANDPAFRSLDEPLQALLDKTLAGLKPEKNKAKKAKEKAIRSKKVKSKKESIFARFRNKTASSDLSAIGHSAEPLYDADALFKTDAGVGLEAYQTLVEANPRWALARLRLAEAQIECGVSDGVANLMMAAEQLPSAMPTILGILQGALPMVSPLEEERLRQVMESMWSDADAMSAERAQIDLARLEAPRMDETDLATLQELFSSVHGLREAWVFNIPCVYAPDVPHHAILGLAPRLPDVDADMLAMQLAEHAAILGTVAVHIETGAPYGGLGDALASQPSLWRTSRA